MNRYEIILFFLTLLWINSDTASKSNNETDLLPRSISGLKKYYEVVENLEQRGILSKKRAEKEKNLYIQYGSKLTGKNKLLTTKEFLSYEENTSILSFSNLIAILAGFIIFIAGVIFAKKFIITNLTDIPSQIWEKFLYFLAFSLMFFPNNSWLIFLACLIFHVTLMVTFYLRPFDQKRDYILTVSCILCITWSIVAAYQQHREVGYLAVIALEIFSLHTMKKKELTGLFGVTENNHIVAATISAFFLIIMGIVLHFTRVNFLSIPFTQPLLFFGTSIYFIGITVLSSDYYHQKKHKNKDLFILLQVIKYFSGFLSALYGPMFDIPFLQGIGGTIFILWISIIYIEKANWSTSESRIISLLGFGIILYAFAYFHKTFLSIFH